jgi:glycosyltransferase involved in cell wall biosynthesis
MNILFISQYFWPEDFKGNDVAFELSQRGHHVTVLTAKPNYPSGKFYPGYSFFGRRFEMYRNVSIIRVPVFPRKKGTAVPLVLNYISFVFFSFIAFLFRIRNKYDIILVQQLSPVFSALPGVWIKKKYKIPMVLWVLDLWPESLTAAGNIRSEMIIAGVNRIVRNVYLNSDQILISSHFFKNSILSKINKIIPISYFPNWAEDIYTRSQSITANKVEFPAGFNILYAGNIGEAQDFESILKAVALTSSRKVNWIIMGDGRKLSWIKKEIEIQKLQNIFLFGRHPLETMPAFFSQANAMLVSLKNEPIFARTVPAKIQAYMASGKLIIGMLNGEGFDLIHEANCGYAVPAGDFEGLAGHAIKVSMMPDEDIRIMEKNGKTFYDNHFSKNKLLDQLENILFEVSK